MIWLSVLLVFGTAGVVVAQLATEGPSLQPGYQQMIHARIPWLLLGPLWLGAALGIAAAVRNWAFYKLGLILLELPLVALASWYFLASSFLPPHDLAVGVGDPFPSYALVDQDGALQRFGASRPNGPALYIFYRGDW
jgi:hypothetical protein